jgi:hypothetical protein
MASRVVGEGGRGPGFMVCATMSGMVEILQDDTTGSVNGFNRPAPSQERKRTSVIPSNRRLHYGFHPISNDGLVFRAEKVRLVVVVVDSEPITTRIHVFVHCNLVTYDIDITFYFRLLISATFTIQHSHSHPSLRKSTYRLAVTFQAI